MILGLYIHDERNSSATKFVARMWQLSLLLFGGIGFAWTTFIFGGYNIAHLYDLLVSSNSKRTEIFIGIGLVFYHFIVPVVQVSSLAYGIFNVYRHMDQPVSVAIVSPLLASCKRTTVIFFTSMVLLIIVIVPITMTRNYYENAYTNYSDDVYLNEIGLQTYPLFIFKKMSSNLILNLTVACYLAVMMLFTSLTMMHINVIQEEVITIVYANNNSLAMDKYLQAKGKIISLNNRSYFSTQLLTLTAAINVISFMFRLWYNHNSYIKSTSSYDTADDFINHVTYSEMLLRNLYLFPYLIKGYHI